MKLGRKKSTDSSSHSEDSAAPAPAPSPPDQPRGQGVNSSGNALRSAWLLGTVLVLVPLLMALAYLHLLRQPAQQAAVLSSLSGSHADERAEALASAIATLRARVAAAAASPAALAAVSAGTRAALDRAESDIAAYFPEASSVRLLALDELGTAGVGDALTDLRNHIEIDLVRRAANGEEALPEAYQVDGQWLVSQAGVASATQPAGSFAVVLVTLPQEVISSWLQGATSPGQFILQQRRGGATIASHGNGLETGQTTVRIDKTPWQLVFRPGAPVNNTVAESVRADSDVLMGVGVLALACLVLVWRRSASALKSGISGIVANAESRSPLSLNIPELEPVAREMRKLTLRKPRSGTAAQPVSGSSAGSSADLQGIEGPAEEPLPGHIFRAYDIRGVADTELTDATVYRIGAALGTLAGKLGEQTLVLAHDGRNSSARISAVLEKALAKSGRDVIKLGLVPTPLMYFATHHLDAQSGVMITGSHNPAEDNGLKIVLKRQPVAEGTIATIREMAERGDFSKGQGRAVQQDISSAYLDEVIGDIALGVPLKIVIDASNGATGHIAPMLFEELGCDVSRLYCEIDGNFPNHSPDTSEESNLKVLIAAVTERGADFGVCYDGDGDRLAVVTSSGRILRTDTLMMLLSRDIVARNPGADVVYDVKCSRMLAQLITSLGGRPVLWKTGHALMRQKMIETGALLGGEFSGHIFFGERWYGFDDGMYATARLAEILSSQEADLDEMLSDLPQAISTPDIRIPVEESAKFDIIQRFIAQAKFDDGKINDLDGLRVDFHDGWGLLRASNTSPALTARFECSDEAGLQQIMGLFREQLGAVAPDIDIPF